MMRRGAPIVVRRTAGLALGLLALLAAGRPLEGAQPRWEEVHRPVYGILRHWMAGVDDPYGWEQWQGIWRFLPDSGTYSRIGTFYFNADGFSIPSGTGDGAFLTAVEDRLLVETWPSFMEIDPVTGRIVRRYPPLDDLSHHGWTVIGPAPSAAEASDLGLARGIYGLQLCQPGLAGSREVLWPCGDPVYRAPMPLSTDDTVGRRSLDPGDLRLWEFSDLDVEPDRADYCRRGWCTTFDPRRGGLWYARTSLFFVPIRGGVLDPTAAYVQPWPTSLELGDSRRAWFYYLDPVTDHFFTVITENAVDRFLELDHELDVVATLGTYNILYPDRGDAMPRTLTRLPATPPESYTQTVPIVVRAPGRGGTYWSSDLFLYNPSATSTVVTVRRVAAPGARPLSVVLPGHGSWFVRDALAWAGGGVSGDGVTHDALVLESPYRWGEQVVASARVSTPSSEPSERAAGGTMGQAVVAVPGTVGYSNHYQRIHGADREAFTSSPAQLVLDTREPGRYRHNLGAVNDTSDPLEITLTWGSREVFSPWFCDGGYEPPAGTEKVVTVAPHSVQVVSVESLFDAAVREGCPAEVAVTADRAAILWFSMVDNVTGDGTFVPFTQMALTAGAETRHAIPAVAYLPGRRGTFWTTDLYGVVDDRQRRREGESESGLPDQPRVWFHPSRPGSDCGAAAAGGELLGTLSGEVPVPTPPGWYAPRLWRTIFADPIHQLDPCADDDDVRGALEVRTGSWTSIYARTYTTRQDGGTFGEILPLYPERGWPVQHFAGIEIDPAFRVNLGLFNGDAEHAITHRLVLYAADGSPVAQREVVLEPWASLVEPLDAMLGLSPGSLPTGIYGLTVLPLDDEAAGVQGRSWAFVSVVDNVTGDPTNWW